MAWQRASLAVGLLWLTASATLSSCTSPAPQSFSVDYDQAEWEEIEYLTGLDNCRAMADEVLVESEKSRPPRDLVTVQGDDRQQKLVRACLRRLPGARVRQADNG